MAHKPTISPTDLSLYRLCAVKDWYVNGPLRLKLPETVALALGTTVHGKVEAYYNRQVEPAAPSPALGQLASDMLEALLSSPHFPKAGTPGLQSEQWLPRTHAGHTGKIDILLQKNIATGVWEAVRIIDIKTCSDKRWAKSPEQLATDPQAIIYCKQVGCLQFSLLYVLTKPPHPTWLVTYTFSQEELDAAYAAIPREQIMVHRQQESPAGIPHSAPQACEKWGGCPFKAKCAAAGIPSMGFLGRMFERGALPAVQMPSHDRSADYLFPVPHPVPDGTTAREVLAMAFKKLSDPPTTAAPTAPEDPRMRRRIPAPQPAPASVAAAADDDDLDATIRVNGGVPAPASVPAVADDDEDDDIRQMELELAKRRTAKAQVAAAAAAAETARAEAAARLVAAAAVRREFEAAEAVRKQAEFDQAKARQAELQKEEDEEADEREGEPKTRKPGSGRPKGAKNKPKVEYTSDTNAAFQSAAAVSDSDTLIEAIADGYTLYVDCMPDGPYTRLEAILEILGPQVVAAASKTEIPAGIPRHYLTLDYAAGGKRLAGFLYELRHTLKGDIVVDRRNPTSGPCLEVLIPAARRRVYGF